MNDENRYSAASPAGLADTDARPEWQRRLRSRRVLVIVGVLVAIALLAWLLTPKGDQSAGRPLRRRRTDAGRGGPRTTGDMPITLIGLGAVTPLATVTVQSQISGQIMQILFKEGQTVKTGAPLFLIDPRPYQVALEQAQGALVRDQALLDNAHIDLHALPDPVEAGLDRRAAARHPEVAGRCRTRAPSRPTRAQIDAQKLNLVYCHITSPIAGRVGLQQVNVGNYITPAEPNGLVVITQMQPITVVFTLAEDAIRRLMAQVHAGKTLAVTAWDRSQYPPARHRHAAVGRQPDRPDDRHRQAQGHLPQRRTRACFRSSSSMSCCCSNTLHGATLIPQAVIQRGAPGTYVYVVDRGPDRERAHGDVSGPATPTTSLSPRD